MGGCGGGCGCHKCGPVQPPPWFRRGGALVAFQPVGRAPRSRRASSCATGACAVPQAAADDHYVGELIDEGPSPDDVWAQERQDFDWSGFYGSPVGVLPGGMTQTEWNAMTQADRTTWVNNNARDERARNELLTESIRQGISGMETVIMAIYAGENARFTREADRIAARETQNYNLQLARIRGETDVALAVANANRPLTTTNPLSTPTPDPNAPMTTGTKVAIGGVVTAGAVGLGLLLWKVLS